LVEDFINKYFIDPIKTGEGYNPVNTAAIALTAVLIGYLILKLLKKLKIKIDERLALAVAPYVFIGSMLRVFEDAKIVSNILFVTPFLFFWGGAVFIAILIFSVLLERRTKIPYFKTMFLVGILAIAALLPKLNFTNLQGAGLIFIYFLPWLFIFGFMKFWALKNRLIMLIQMLDATATAVGINYFGYSEEHVIPNIVIQLFGPFSFLFVKLLGVALILYLIDKTSEDNELNNYLKIAIGVIGGFTGSRDILRLLTLS